MLKKSKILIGLAALALALGIGTPAFAAEDLTPAQGARDIMLISSDDEDAEELDESIVNDEEGAFAFGDNLFFMGANSTNRSIIKGLMFSMGNKLGLQGEAMYNFAMANFLDVTGETERDLFAMGNVVTLDKNAKIGGDVYLMANQATISANLPGDLNYLGNKLILENTTIFGNLSVEVEMIELGENVKIVGNLTYNEDAYVSGLEDAKVGTITTYVNETYQPSAAEIWWEQFINVAGAFITAIFIILVFPKLKSTVKEGTTGSQFGSSLLAGIGFTLLVPIVSILLLMTGIAWSTAMIMIGVYILALCLGGIFAGIWFGHLVVEKILKTPAPLIFEAFVGIVILGLIGMLPVAGGLVDAIASIFGVGYMISVIRPKKSAPAEVAAPTAKPLDNPFRGTKPTRKPSTKKGPASTNTKKVTKTAKSKSAK